MVENRMKKAQKRLKQLHGQTCIFSRSIFKFQAKNETEISKIILTLVLIWIHSPICISDELLQQHLLRTLCNDMGDILIDLSNKSPTSGNGGPLSNEVRTLRQFLKNIMNDFDDDIGTK